MVCIPRSLFWVTSFLLIGVAGCQHAGTDPRLPDTFAPTDREHLTAPSRPIYPFRDLTEFGQPLPVHPSLAGDAPPSLTYTLAVSNVNVQDFIFALARDSRVNVDIHPDIQGRVSINAVDQNLIQILDRLTQQLDLRYEHRDGILRILPDTPYLVHYPVDYVNLNRQINATISANTQISSGPSGDLRMLAQSSNGAGNISNTRVENQSIHHFWSSLEKNIQDILRETDKLLPEGSYDTITEENQQHQSQGVKATGTAQAPGKRNKNQMASPAPLFALPPPQIPTAESQHSQDTETRVVKNRTFREAASVILNPEGGQISVRATARQHATVREFLRQSLAAAHRQVLIEATIVEVELADLYQQGVDWSRLRADGNQSFSMTRAEVGGDPTSGILPFTLRSQDKRSTLSSQFALDLLRAFGKVNVLSSPRLVVLNNQTALLKVVENIVYFNVKADTVVTANVGPTTTVTTTPQSVSVGLVMSVTPQISESSRVTLNIRPTISSIAKFVPDPNPVIPIPNQVPQIRTREIESILSLDAGEIAMLGGLMEDRREQKTGQFPGLSEIPLFGELFTTRNNSHRKSELIILLRPVRLDRSSGPNLSTAFASPTLGGASFSLKDLEWLDQGNYSENTLPILEGLRSEHPRSTGVWLALGNHYFRRHQFSQASLAYRTATRLAPEHPDPWSNLANSLIQEGQTELAKTYLLRAQQKLQSVPALTYSTTPAWIQARLQQLDPATTSRR